MIYSANLSHNKNYRDFYTFLELKRTAFKLLFIPEIIQNKVNLEVKNFYIS